LNHPVEACGLYSKEDMREVHETRMEARWFLGKALAQIERAKAPGKGKMALSGLTSLLEQIGLTKPTALAAQRLATLPEADRARLRARPRSWRGPEHRRRAGNGRYCQFDAKHALAR
jgi:hypothetical protein